MKCFKLFVDVKLYLICIPSYNLKDSERGVRTLKIIEGVESCQLLQIWKQVQHFVNCSTRDLK
jgi:hypothetical protein